MKQRLFIYLIFISYMGIAQVGFEKTFKFLVNEEAAKSCIQDSDGGFVLAIGPKSSSAIFIREYGLIKLNTYGDTVWKTTFFMNYYSTMELVKKAPDKGFITIGLAEDSVTGMNNAMLWIAKYDSLGYLSWSRFYSGPQFKYFTPTSLSAEFIQNTLFLCTGTNGKFLLFDSLYNFTSIHSYTGFNHNIGSIKELSLQFNNNFWYYITYQPILFGNNTIKILEVATNGDTVKSISVPADTLLAGRLIKVTNSYFLAIGYKNSGTSQSKFSISKIDSTGATIWTKKMSSTNFLLSQSQFTSYTTLLNGNHVVNFGPKNPLVNKKSFIYCFNDNGDSLWTNEYMKDSTLNQTYLMDIIPTADSGLVSCGVIEDSAGVWKSYIVKTNAQGTILGSSFQAISHEEPYLHMYPNPTSTNISIHYIGNKSNSKFCVYSVQGKLLYEKLLTDIDNRFTLNTTQFPSGFYICSIFCEGQKVLSKKLAVIK
ncbi:MAG TPA: T9SS type A sorting domain-containing protein [Bacteroidia bacterium]|nr:T9SS type A sorting domain-containing protein [Bacteroidia bacterium]